VVPGSLNDELKKAIDLWNDPRTVFTSTHCTIFGHERGFRPHGKVTPQEDRIRVDLETEETLTIDKFAMEDFDGMDATEKQDFIEWVTEEVNTVKALSEQIGRRIDQQIIEQLEKEGPWRAVRNGKRGIWRGRRR